MRSLSPQQQDSREGGRIWDLRQGDAEDNRTSPRVHGLPRVIFSTALEFRYFKSLLSFLILVIGPALLLGLAPSVARTYGQLKYEAGSMLGRSPIVGLVLLVILAGIALGLWRPLTRSVVSIFWDLHYTLVFPLFVVLREILRMAAERVPDRATSPEQIHRRRQIGTILAALLVVGGGLGLTIAVLNSSGLQMLDLRHVQPWVFARAALVNAAVIFGVSAAVESLYWLWHQPDFSGPVVNWEPAASNLEVNGPRVAHLSDLHLVGQRYGYRMETGTGGPRGNRRMDRALRQVAAAHAVTRLDHILVTGDITDAGTRAEWTEFLDLLQSYPELRACLSFVPGNHDVNVADRSRAGHFDLPWSAGLALRRLRVVLALAAIQGERARVVDRANGALGPSLNEYLQKGERAERLRALARNGALRGRRAMANVWEEVFPLVEPPRRQDGYGIILLNSNSRGYFSLTNAVGVVNPSQLKALKCILRDFPHAAWAILLHHQIVEYPVTSIGFRERITLALVNAADLLSALRPHASRVIVFHGHRHWDWIGKCGNVVLCSAPSVMLGSHDEEDGSGKFHIHKLALGPNGVFRLSTTERVVVE
jgi:hypothetical protein